MDLKTKISQARKQANLSQQALGDIIGVSDKAVSAYEVGRSSPPIKVLEKISTATNKPLSYFIQNSPQATPDIIMEKLNEVGNQLDSIRKLLDQQTAPPTSN